MFVLKNFHIPYNNLTRIQLHNTYVENISCFIFILWWVRKFFNENFPNYSISVVSVHIHCANYLYWFALFMLCVVVTEWATTKYMYVYVGEVHFLSVQKSLSEDT